MSHITLAKPAQGESVVIAAYSGKVLELAFSSESAELARSGQDLHIGFADDSTIVLPNFYTVYAETPLPSFVVNGVLTSGSQFLESQVGSFVPRTTVADTGGRFALLPDAELMDGTDALGHIGQNGQEHPLNFLIPEPGTESSLRAETFFAAQHSVAPVLKASTQHDGNDSLLAFASDDALFGGDDNDTLIGAPGHNLADSTADKVYGGNTESVVLYDAEANFITDDSGIDFLIQKADGIPDTLDSLLEDSNKNVDVLVRVDDGMDITNMTDLANLGLAVESETLVFSEQWTRDGNVFPHNNHTAIVEVNTAENDIQANMVRVSLENNS